MRDGRADLLAQACDRERQLVAAPRRLAEPERDGGRRALGVLHAHAAGFHLQDAVAGVAQLEDVAREALDGEVLVDGADAVGLRLEHHGVVAGLGNRAARRERRHARAAPLAQLALHGVAMQVRAARALARGVALGQHAQHRVVALARQRGVGPGAAHQREQGVFVPVATRGLGDDLLREHVQRRRRHVQRVEFAAADRIQQRGAFDELVARLREQPCLGRAADGMAGAAGALQERGDRARRAELAHEVDVADVQPQLQRRRGHQHLQLAALEPLLGIQPELAREAAVVGGDGLLAEQVAQVARGALGHAARVDEDQRGAVLRDQLHDALVDLLPLVVGHDRGQRRRRHLQRQVALLGIADVDDLARRDAVHQAGAADQEARHFGDRLLRGRQSDARDAARHAQGLDGLGIGQRAFAVGFAGDGRARRLVDHRLQPLQRQRQVAAALVGGQRVDLVDDHRAHGRQHAPARQRAQQHVQRLGRGDEDVRRPAQVVLALALRRVAGAHGGADVDVRQAQPGQFGADAGQRFLEVGADVVGQRLQRRHVDDGGLVRQLAFDAAPHQVVERGQEGGQRLARAGGRGHQRVAPGADGRPRRDLRGSGRAEAALEPARDGGMEVLKGHGVDERRWRPNPHSQANEAHAARG